MSHEEQRRAVVESLTGCHACRKPGLPTQLAGKPTHEVAAIARTTTSTHELHVAIRELEVRASVADHLNPKPRVEGEA